MALYARELRWRRFTRERMRSKTYEHKYTQICCFVLARHGCMARRLAHVRLSLGPWWSLLLGLIVTILKFASIFKSAVHFWVGLELWKYENWFAVLKHITPLSSAFSLRFVEVLQSHFHLEKAIWRWELELSQVLKRQVPTDLVKFWTSRWLWTPASSEKSPDLSMDTKMSN
jgi:hypothetical protein